MPYTKSYNYAFEHACMYAVYLGFVYVIVLGFWVCGGYAQGPGPCNQITLQSNTSYAGVYVTDSDAFTMLAMSILPPMSLPSDATLYAMDTDSMVTLPTGTPDLCMLQEQAQRHNIRMQNVNYTYGHPRLLWTIDGLRPATNYSLYLVSQSQAMIYLPTYFKTKRPDSPCHLLRGPAYCPRAFYSVPMLSDPVQQRLQFKMWNDTLSLWHENFTVTLSTFPCGTAFYSYVRRCDEAIEAYRDWLCATQLPRCTDPDAPNAVLKSQDYSANAPTPESSRSALIPSIETIGIYGEVPPCLMLCNEVSRTSPPLIQWLCPIALGNSGYQTTIDMGDFAPQINSLPPHKGGSQGLSQDRFGNVHCNALGLDWFLAGYK